MTTFNQDLTPIVVSRPVQNHRFSFFRNLPAGDGRYWSRGYHHSPRNEHCLHIRVRRRAVAKGKPGNGGILAYDLNKEGTRPINLTPDIDPDFQPHGISLYMDKDGQDVLYVYDRNLATHEISLKETIDLHTSLDNAEISGSSVAAVNGDRMLIGAVFDPKFLDCQLQ